MFDYGEHGYHEYRATQGSDKMNYKATFGSRLAKTDNEDRPGLLFLIYVIGASIGFFFVYFIGCFLWHSYN
jgi:hypothetical protein